MKVTGMFPGIVCKNDQDVLDFAKDYLGFDIAHQMHAIISDNEEDQIYVLKNESDVRFDVIKFDVEKPFYSTCMNVDDFDEANRLLEERGWHIVDGPVTTNNAKKALLNSKDGLSLLLIQHYKKIY